jgi:segregation and condensation protein B
MSGPGTLDRTLAHLSPGARRRLWLARIEAVLFASARPVGTAALARVVGADVPVERLMEELSAALAARPYELVRTGEGWMLRTRVEHAAAIRAAADPDPQAPAFSEREMMVLSAIAYHQPIDRAGLREIFGQDVSRDVLGRLRQRDLITTGPRSPRPGAPHTFVTTPHFLTTFDLRSLRDLPDPGLPDDRG